MLGDCAFSWKLKTIWNLIIISGTLMLSCNLILHFIFHKTYYYPFLLRKRSSPQKLPKIFKCLLKATEIAVNVFTYGFILLFFISYYLSSTIYELMMFGLPWLLYEWLFIRNAASIAIWFPLYFTIKCLSLKLIAELENTRLNLMAKDKPRSIHLLIILRKMTKIHFTIEMENKFWSNYLFSTCFGLGFLCGVIVAQLLGDNNYFIKIFFLYMLLNVIALISLLLCPATRVYEEVNNSLKFLNKIVFNPNIKSISIGLRIKVWIDVFF